MSHGHALSPDSRTALLGFLGLNSAAAEHAASVLRVVFEVEYALGFYAGGVQAFDNSPRPADYVRVFEQLRVASFHLWNAQAFHSDFYREKLEARLGESAIAKIELDVAALLDAAVALKKEFESQRSSGRPRGTALRMTIQMLCGTFRRHYAGPLTPARKNGASTIRSEQDARELSFVRQALTDANIPFRNLPSLLRDPRCAVSEAPPPTAQASPEPKSPRKK